jgi:hypothetical protein
MRPTKKHIGKLFTIPGSDGSWAYILVSVNRLSLLFYSIPSGKYWIEDKSANDWKLFKFPNEWIVRGWLEGTIVKGGC